MTDQKQSLTQFLLRLALGISMLSAVADRLGFWGSQATWGDWEHFEAYTLQLTFFLPKLVGQFSAYAATFLEIAFSILLILGIKIRWAAYGTGILLSIFAVSMSIALGIKSTFDYSVWTGSMAAFTR